MGFLVLRRIGFIEFTEDSFIEFTEDSFDDDFLGYVESGEGLAGGGEFGWDVLICRGCRTV